MFLDIEDSFVRGGWGKVVGVIMGVIMNSASQEKENIVLGLLLNRKGNEKNLKIYMLMLESWHFSS